MPTREELKTLLRAVPLAEVRSIVTELEEEAAELLDMPMPAYGAPFFSMDEDYAVELQVVPEARMPVILLVRQTLGLGLGEALDLVKRAPQVIKRFDYEYEAKDLVEKFRGAGATAAILRE